MLPVTVEESKAQRLQRQQARFRDRGGAFVPSEKNALKDILLARTVSGESPSKVATKSPYRHRSHSTSPSKAKRNKTTSKAQESHIKDRVSRLKTNTEEPAGLVSGNAVAGPSIESGSKISKAQTKKKAGHTTRKGKGKAKATDGNDVSEAETTKVKPAPKRRGRPPKTKPQAGDLDIDANLEPLNRKTRTSKAKPPDISKVKAKLAEAPRSDDEGTLVEAPRPKTHSKRKPVIVTIESDDEDAHMPDNKPATAEPSVIPKSAHKQPSAKEAPLNRAQAKRRTENRKEHSDEEPTDSSQTRKHSKWTEVNEESPHTVKTKTYGSLIVDIPMKKSATNPKRSAPDDDVSRDVKQPLKKPKVSKSQGAKSSPLSNSVAVSKPDAEDSAVRKPHSAMKQNTKRKKERPPESDDEDHMPKKPVSKKARFDEEPKPRYVL
ncbi:uncharacterized protein BJ212DRAFT_1388268 [Suillus subaureus]|uniref:Uncharacterized protein n=1 Tax=Suillus subaureus TaxID=48587 RepID=A0A9P7DZV1_9AGAM|nr:uncharacterized protein BJ212DRAFT_1388268 [Suillus subaureus]KAG1807158.1 hypothetical protein BJ212DRAFT_1388268 [Suillus subaureus]